MLKIIAIIITADNEFELQLLINNFLKNVHPDVLITALLLIL